MRAWTRRTDHWSFRPARDFWSPGRSVSARNGLSCALIIAFGAVSPVPVGAQESSSDSSTSRDVSETSREVPAPQAELNPPPDDTAFDAQFTDLAQPHLTDSGSIDLAIPDDAVDLSSFDPPIEGDRVLRYLGTGVASYYGRRFHGRLTANGERFDMNAMTAAHKTLPFGTMVRVTNQSNGRSVTVRINDRGPFIPGRSIDLSRSAAERIGLIQSGHASVHMDLVAP